MLISADTFHRLPLVPSPWTPLAPHVSFVSFWSGVWHFWLGAVALAQRVQKSHRVSRSTSISYESFKQETKSCVTHEKPSQGLCG